jgi:hypothetical protein
MVFQSFSGSRSLGLHEDCPTVADSMATLLQRARRLAKATLPGAALVALAVLQSGSVLLGTSIARAATLTEDFEDPFPAWESRWLASNSNLTNYYEESNGCYGVDCRGNNPDGLWISDGIAGQQSTFITFNPTFGATLTSLQLDIAGFAAGSVLEVFDSNSNILLSTAITLTNGAYTDPGTYATYQVNSSNGIGGWNILSGLTQIEGNTSIDNVIVNTSDTTAVPGSLPLFGAAAAFGYSRKLRKRILTSKG